jgi:hypothetical protein
LCFSSASSATGAYIVKFRWATIKESTGLHRKNIQVNDRKIFRDCWAFLHLNIEEPEAILLWSIEFYLLIVDSRTAIITMNPLQRNKVDISSMSPDEQRLFRLYGKLPTKRDLLQNKLKERKYFDSGDYALSKAGKASDVGVTNIGSRHPLPENIPHLTATSPGANSLVGGNNAAQTQPAPGSISGHPGSVGFHSRSPIKEASFLHRRTIANESDKIDEPTTDDSVKEPSKKLSTSPPARESMPIGR